MTDTCPLCRTPSPTPFVVRRDVPVHQNLLSRTVEDARGVRRGDLVMHACARCGFVFNAAFDASRLSYGDDYENTQTASGVFSAYVDELVERLVERHGVKAARIVEVGCGKGGFIERLVTAPAGEGNRGIGFDPTYLGPLEKHDGRLRFERKFYGPDCVDTEADVVICRHVIEHVADPVELLRTVRAALVKMPHARVFFETPCVEWILRHRVVWDFFYEHCSLFTAASLSTAFRLAGFEVREVSHVFGGQYLWLEATPGTVTTAVAPAGDVPVLAEAFSVAEDKLIGRLRSALEEARARGPVAIWGAGAKGATCASLVDPGARLLACVADVNPQKQGRFLPGTAHPIVAPRDFRDYGVRSAFLMNPNYRLEALELLAREGITVELVTYGDDAQ